MKNLIVLILFFLPITSFSQTHNFDEDSIQFYFLRFLDSLRFEKHGELPKLLVSETASDACKHHNKYLSDMQLYDGRTTFITHDEVMQDAEFKYRGKDTLIDWYIDRAKFYNTAKDFGPIAEVITKKTLWLENEKDSTITTNFINEYMNNRWIAGRMMNSFKTSPDHLRIISGYKYTMVAIDVSIIRGMVYLTMIVGNKYETVDGKIISISNENPK
jgi:hypothetical protein